VACINQQVNFLDVASVKETRHIVLGDAAKPRVFPICLAPDGKAIASASAEGPVFLWDADTGKEIRQFLGHTALAGGLAFSPDGKTLVTVSIDRSARFWDVASGKEMRRLAGSPLGSFTPVAFAPDGKTLATSGVTPQATIHLWNAETGKELRSLTGHPLPGVHSLAFSPDGKTLFSAGYDQTIRQWETASGEARGVVLTGGRNQQNLITALAYSPDASMVAAAGSQTITLVDAGSGQEIRHWPSAGNMTGLAFSPNGKALASWTFNIPVIYLWDPATGKELRQIQTQVLRTQSVTFSPDAKMLAACDPAQVILWETETGNEVGKLAALSTSSIHSYQTRRLDFSPDGKTLALLGNGRVVRLWDWAGGQPVRQIAGRFTLGRTLRFAADGKTLTVLDNFGGLHFLDVAAGKEIGQAQIATGPITPAALDFSADGKSLATGSFDGIIQLWDVGSGKEQTTHLPPRAPIARVAFQDGARTVVALTNKDHMQVTDVASGKIVSRFAEITRGTGTVATVAPDGKLAAFVNFDAPASGPFLWIVDAATGRELHKIKDSGATALAFAPDGNTLAVTGRDHIVSFWDSRKGQELRQLVCQEPQSFTHIIWGADGRSVFLANANRIILHYEIGSGRELRRFLAQPVAANPAQPAQPRPGFLITALAQSRDGRVLAAGSQDGVVHLWETSTGRERLQLKSYQPRAVRSLVFAADGRTLISTGDAIGNDPAEQAIRFWDLESGKESATLTGHRKTVTSLALSADGKTLASGSLDTTVLLWDVADRLTRPQPERELSSDQLEKAWSDLALEDGLKAYQAIRLLAAAGKQAVPLLKERVQPVSVTAHQIAQLISDLDSNQFVTREKAKEQLEQLAELAEPAVRQALQNKPSLEVAQRLEQILRLVERREVSLAEARSLRAAEVLEEVGTPEARQLLQKLAEGTAEARLTRDAKASLERLTQRPALPR
jgi:WD40 repeat protein